MMKVYDQNGHLSGSKSQFVPHTPNGVTVIEASIAGTAVFGEDYIKRVDPGSPYLRESVIRLRLVPEVYDLDPLTAARVLAEPVANQVGMDNELTEYHNYVANVVKKYSAYLIGRLNHTRRVRELFKDHDAVLDEDSTGITHLDVPDALRSTEGVRPQMLAVELRYEEHRQWSVEQITKVLSALGEPGSVTELGLGSHDDFPEIRARLRQNQADPTTREGRPDKLYVRREAFSWAEVKSTSVSGQER